MKAGTLDVFKIFERAHGESEAKKIITYFESADTAAIEKEVNQKTGILVTKEDLYEVKDAIKEEISELKIVIEKSSKEHFKWMFIFFIPLYLTLLGFILVNLTNIF